MKTQRTYTWSKAVALTLITLSLAVPTAVATNKKNDPAEVLGFITRCSEPIAFVPVAATCGSQTLSVLTGSTNGDKGKYSITFANATCNPGSTVNVTATKDGIPHTGTGIMGTYFWFARKAKVDIDIGSDCPTPTVPEFGLISGIIALAGSAGSYYLLRRKVS